MKKKKPTTNKINLEIKGLISSFIFIIWENQGRTLDTGSRSRGRSLLTGLLPTVCSACFLRAPWTTSSGVALLSKGWAFPCQSLFKKIHHNPALKPVLWVHFLNRDSLFQDDYNSYQVDIKLTSTPFMFFLVTSGIHSYKIFSFLSVVFTFFIF